MAVEDINKRVRAMSEKNIEKGQEMEEVQKSQSELLNINNERRNNLNTARVESAMEAENNQNLAQAATLMAAGVGGGMAVSQQVQDFNPQTQALLSKYGVGKPKQNTITSKNSQVTPQKVTINNTTTTNTTNNVQVSQPNIPISQPQIAIKQQANQGEGKIKAWLSGVFARQNERAALREKEYQKRESTLTRSANKMMRRMEEVGKTFAERLDPRRIGNVFGDQIKTLMFLFGFGMLSKNWDKVLGFVSKAEEFYNWVKGDKDGFLDGLGAKLTKFIGGKDGETFVQAFTGLFDDLKSRITDTFKNFGADISDRFEAFMESRADAVKAIKFPEIDVSNIGNTLKALGLYLGDVMTALVSGTQGVKDAIGHQVNQTGLLGSLKERKGGVSITKEYEGGKYDNVDDTSYGDAVLVKGDKYGKTYQGLLTSAVTSDGDLKNTASATISQARAIDSAVSDTEFGQINTAQVASGLQRLSKVAEDNGSVVVDQSFVTTKLTPDQIKSLKASKDLKEVEYKLVRTEKTEEDLPANFKKKLLEEGMKTLAVNKAGETVGGVGGYITRVGANTKRMVDGDDSIAQTLFSAVPGIGDDLAYLDDIGDAIDSQIARWAADKYKLELVPVNDPREAAVKIDKTTPETFKFYEVSPKVISEIGKSMTNKDDAVIDTGDKSFVQAIQDNLLKLAEDWDVKRKKVHYKYYDVDVNGAYKQLDNLNKKEAARQEKLKRNKEVREKEFEEKHNGDRFDVTVDNTVELAKDIYNQGKKAIRSFIGGFTPVRKLLSDSKELSKAELETRITKSIDKLVKRFNLTPEQASGIVGNWMQESGMKTTAFNPEGGGEGAVGLAQWRGARIRKFEGRAKEGEGNNYTGPGAGTSLYDATFDQQLDYAIWELENSHKSAIKKLKEASDSTEAADIGLGYYEFSAGLNKALEQLGSHAMLENRRNYAYTALQVYNESPEAKNNILPDEVEVSQGEGDVLLAENITPEGNTTQTTSGGSATGKSEVPYFLAKVDDQEVSVNPEFQGGGFNWGASMTTPVNIAQATPVWNTSFSSSPEKVTPVISTNKNSDNLLTKVDEISNTLGGQTVAIQNLAVGVTALAEVAVTTGNTTINNGGSNISRDPSFISVPGQNIV